MRMLSPLFNDWTRQRPTLSPEWIMGDIYTDFESMLENALKSRATSSANIVPNADTRETETHYMISLDMPGIKKEDIKLEFLDQRLSVSGERRRASSEDSTVKFTRIFDLSKKVDSEQIEAAYEDGVLNISIPKAAEAQPRTIQINGEKSGYLSKLLGTKKVQEEKNTEVQAS